MAHKVLVLEEVIAMLQVVDTPEKYIAKFREQAEAVLGKKPLKGIDEITVSSGRGQKSQKGFVELTLNDLRSQMEAVKAREVWLMLLEAAEAAQSDEIFLKLLERIGITDIQRQGQILLELRELRQGSRNVVFPT